jgi:hypothetical protein
MIPPENLFISKNINLILFLLIYFKFMVINSVSITNLGVYVDISAMKWIIKKTVIKFDFTYCIKLLLVLVLYLSLDHVGVRSRVSCAQWDGAVKDALDIRVDFLPEFGSIAFVRNFWLGIVEYA